MTTIHAPSNYTGTAMFGPLLLDFKDGQATYDGELPDGMRHYLASAGYGIDGHAPTVDDPPEPADPRTVEIDSGAPLRDAAVDPHPEDYLPPVNAGQDNPHGPRVVAPGIHGANMPKPIHPGPVGRSGNLNTPDTVDDPNVVKDTDVQADNESRLAAAVLIDQQPVQDATAAAAQVDPVGTDAFNVDGPFDPSRHTVAEVNEHLATADDTERARVLAAEQDGKNRVTLVGNAGE